MILKLSKAVLQNVYQKSFSTTSRNFSAVPLAYLEFPKDETKREKSLIVMHGLFGSKSNWNSLCKAFAAKTNPSRKIYAIDARNHGESQHTTEHNNDLLAADLRKFIEDHNLGKSSLIGHSMGGRACSYFALKYPELVEKLVIVDISPRGRIGTVQSDIPLFIRAMRSIHVPNTYTIHEGRKVADDKLSTIISERSLRDFLITNLMKTESGDFRWRINLETLDRCFQEGIAKPPDVTGLQFTGPTLFIGGTKSDYLKPSDKASIDELFPNSQLEFLDAGHWVHAEKSEEFLKLVLKFLNE